MVIKKQNINYVVINYYDCTHETFETKDGVNEYLNDNCVDDLDMDHFTVLECSSMGIESLEIQKDTKAIYKI